MTNEDLVRLFCEARDWDQFHAPEHLAIGIVTEATELLSVFRFKTREQISEILGTPRGRERISDELGDIYFFLLRFAQMNGFVLSDSLQAKIRKNEVRYPVEKSRGRNLKYDELDK